MSLFRRSKPPLERFPPERWNRLFTTIPMHGILFSAQHGLAFDDVFQTRFFGGYLAGFPTYLDDIDERLGAAVRKALYTAMFGEERGRDTFQKIAAHLTLGDQQTVRGAGFGQPDGQRFFEAVEGKRDPYGKEIFMSLDSAFEAGFMDIDSRL